MSDIAYAQVVIIIVIGVVFGLAGTATFFAVNAAVDRISQHLSKQEK